MTDKMQSWCFMISFFALAGFLLSVPIISLQHKPTQATLVVVQLGIFISFFATLIIGTITTKEDKL